MNSKYCKHFNGPFRNDTCDAGINYLELVGGRKPGWTRLLPCLLEQESEIICDKCRPPTKEEIEESNREWKKVIDNITKVQPFIEEIKNKYDGVGSNGVAECPVCKNKLHWAISAYNGHTRGKSETEGCLCWME